MTQGLKAVRTIFFSRLGTGAGAEGTLTDWAKAILENGDDCDVIVGKSTLRQRLQLRWKIRRFVGPTPGKLAVSPLCRLVDLWVAPSVQWSDCSPGGRHRWTAIRLILDPRRFRARKLLRRAETILVGNVVSPRGLSELLVTTSSAHLVLHHNGNPTDFAKDWLRRKTSRVQSHGRDDQTYFEGFSSVVFQSEAHLRLFSELYPTAQQLTRVIWPSCDERRAKRCAARSSPFNPENFNLLGVSKFQPGKHQLEILNAFLAICEKHPAIHLTLLGGSVADRKYLNECKKVVAQNGLSNRVSLSGYRADALRFMAHADVFLHFSIGDGVSRAVREAALLKKPMVLSTDAGNMSFLGREAAMFIDPNSVYQAAQAISALVESAESRYQYAVAASLRYTSLSSWPLFASNVKTFLTAIQVRSAV